MSKGNSNNTKADQDNRSRQLNPERPEYHSSRGEDAPPAPAPSPAPATPPPTTPST